MFGERIELNRATRGLREGVDHSFPILYSTSAILTRSTDIRQRFVFLVDLRHDLFRIPRCGSPFTRDDILFFLTFLSPYFFLLFHEDILTDILDESQLLWLNFLLPFIC